MIYHDEYNYESWWLITSSCTQTHYDRAKSCQLNVRTLSQSANKQIRQVSHDLCGLLDYDTISLVSSHQHFKYTALVFMAEMNLEKYCVIYEKIKKNGSRTLLANQPAFVKCAAKFWKEEWLLRINYET